MAKIDRDVLKAMLNGTKVKEVEILKQLNSGKVDSHKIEEAMKNSDAPSVKDIDFNKVANMKKPDEVSPDAIKALLSGKKVSEIVKEGNAFIKKDETIFKDGVVNNSDEQPTKAPIITREIDAPVTSSAKIDIDEVKDVVYEILAEAIGISNEKIKDKEYVKKTLSEVHAFIKLREALL